MKFLIILTFISINAIAHMESVPGPHHGFIRMPGLYHTELVENSNEVFDIYLLDINFKNPQVLNSFVELSYESKAGVTDFKCQPDKVKFTCKSNKKLDKTVGKFKLKSKRGNEVGQLAIYELPLSLSGNKMDK